MGDNVKNVRRGLPRKLNEAETHDSFAHWQALFRSCYRQDDNLKIFFSANYTWNTNAANWGLQAETQGMNRGIDDLKEDLTEFLNLINSYLPNSFLRERIFRQSRNLKSVYDIIAKSYGIKVTGASWLQLLKIKRRSQESHLQLFERLMDFAEKHLVKDVNKEVDGVQVPAGGDKMSVSIMNMITLQWLKIIHVDAADVIEQHYAAELAKGTQICELVEQISQSVDGLISVKRVAASIRSVEMEEGQEEDQTKINRINDSGRGRNWKDRKPSRGGSSGSSFTPRRDDRSKGKNTSNAKYETRKAKCSNCSFLAAKLGLDIRTDHFPDQCKNRKTVVRMVDADDDVEDLADESESAGEDHFDTEGEKFLMNVENKENEHANNLTQVRRTRTEIVNDKITVNINLNDLTNKSQEKEEFSPAFRSEPHVTGSTRDRERERICCCY